MLSDSSSITSTVARPGFYEVKNSLTFACPGPVERRARHLSRRFTRDKRRVGLWQTVLSVTAYHPNLEACSAEFPREILRAVQPQAMHLVVSSVVVSDFPEAGDPAGQCSQLWILLLFEQRHPVLPFGKPFGSGSCRGLSRLRYVEDEDTSVV